MANRAPITSPRLVLVCAVVLAVLWQVGFAAADSIESKSGRVIQGKILSRDDKFVVMEVKIGARTLKRKYGVKLLRAITIDGKREVLDGSGATRPPRTGNTPPGTGSTRPGDAAAGVKRSRREIEAMIGNVGAAPPDWFESTQLNFPDTLDLSWPQPPPKGWNNRKNVGQFIWDVVNPNPGRWREGIRFLHHLLTMHQKDADLSARIMRSIAGMYHRFFQDYARAAFWWRKAGIKTTNEVVRLAECYWKLGNKAMAMELLNRYPSPIPINRIKLLADMGQTAEALKLAERFGATKGAGAAFMHAGDACRLAGRYAEAARYYQRVLDLPDAKSGKRFKERAAASIAAIRLFDTLDIKRVPDGTYKASSLGYQGQVQVEVKVASGRIESVRVTQHKEKQFYASLTDIPNQIVARQSVKGVDATSGATITSEAIINATAKALAAAMK